jgi:pimeloyl-ACP methyl ester carboxylesterase
MDHVTSADGTTIAFDRSGDGLPVILVCGGSTDRTSNAGLAEVLSSNFTVYNYDRRGRGDSGDTAPYAVEREVEDIQALIEEAGGSAFAFGHSSGGALALEAAARTLGITKLAVYEPPFIVDASRPPLPDDSIERLTELASTDRRGDAVEYFMVTGVGVPPEALAPMKDSPFWPALEAVAHTLPYDMRVMGGNLSGKPLQADRWASVTIPTLVIDGGASPPWLGNAAQGLVDVLPEARRQTIEGQTHEVDPALLVPVLEEFFAG